MTVKPDDQGPTLAQLVRESFYRLFADEAIPLAGNIAFRTLFSVFPFLIFLTALAGFFGNDDLAAGVVSFLLSVAPARLVEPLVPEIRSILTVPRSGLLSISALITIWSAMGGVDSVRVGLNRAYDLRETRSIWWLYFQNVLFIIGSAVFLLIFALLIVFAPVMIQFAEVYAPALKGHFVTLEQLRFPIGITLLTAGVLLCHRVLPAKAHNVLEVLPGVVITVVAWVAMSSAFSIYLVKFNTFASTYASLSGIFTAMFFVYLAALVLILGGEVNRVLEVRRIMRMQRFRERGDAEL
ncbi:YihY/virulence factor BrkB family protein [Aestuariivirga sp.]|uniref:YihY/virulence factor BrkB family protein n=1 Tax=Aestuariivirga sp. TaxID=2650926 RepID=UPI0025B92952|nr:YihY/virulence factor BrkB family protein [Aestuariivirga sp.]MCA3554698.1 YihY/virulence factor BrkB family protein [Aestuariivirga sp.]